MAVSIPDPAPDKKHVQVAATLSRPSGLARFRPTHADVLFIAIMTWSFLAGESGMSRLLMDGDAGVHIRIGDWIRAHGTIPHEDLFGFSKPHGEWLAYEWLSGVIFSMANSAAGLKGVTLMAATLLSLVTGFVALHSVWRGASGVVLVPMVLIGTNVLNIHFLARPHIFTLLLLAAVAWIVERDRREPSHRIWIVVPLMAIWANLHGGFFIVFPYLALLGIGCVLERKPGAKRYATLFAASALATLANPYGWKLHAHVVGYLRSDWVVRFVDEFQSPKFRSEPMLCFMMLLFTALAVAGVMLKRGRYTEVLWIAFFSYCALVSVRHTTVWMTIVIPIVAEELTNWWPSTHKMINFELKSMTVWPALFVGFLAFSPLIEWPTQFPSDLFPIAMVEKHRETLRDGRVFTTDQWSDYLLWRNFDATATPGAKNQQVFMDARHNYFGEKIGNDFLRLIHGLPGWNKVVDDYALDAMLLPPDIALTAILSERPEWRLADRDSRAVLFVRRPLESANRTPSASLRPGGCPPSCDSPRRTKLSAAR